MTALAEVAMLNKKLTDGFKECVKRSSRLMEQKRKESCLFGTFNVKALAAIIIMVEMWTVGNQEEDWSKTDFAEYYRGANFLCIILPLLAILILALGGLRFKKAWMLIPAILIHAVFAIVFALATVFATIIWIMIQYNPSHFVVVIRGATIHAAFLYITLVLCWSYSALKFNISGPILPTMNKTKKASGSILPTMNVINPNFEPCKQFVLPGPAPASN